jgi:preprotein translocase subunit YajC
VVLNFLLQSPGTANPVMGFLPILLIFAIFYFLLFLPMQRQKKQQKKMLSELQNGQQVVTTGGVVGTIVAVNDDDTLFLRVKPDNLKIQVTRSAVAAVLPEGSKK